MPSPKREEVAEKDPTGLKFFDKLQPLLARLHDDACSRDRAGNRKLHFDQYTMLVLLFLFNPIVVSLARSWPPLPKMMAASWLKANWQVPENFSNCATQ